MNKKILAIYLAAIVVLFFSFSALPHFQPAKISVVPTPFSSPPAAQPTAHSAVLGIQTKTSGCIIQGAFPDKDCTPGAIFPNVTSDQVCVSDYSSSVRDVPVSEKNAVYQEYGITTHQTGEYEIDHYISLELGGSNDISNLFPEAAAPTPGFHEKDKVENYLHQQVCNGAITLQRAQQEISTNWLQVYQQIAP
jgi:hypothetical protein